MKITSVFIEIKFTSISFTQSGGHNLICSFIHDDSLVREIEPPICMAFKCMLHLN